MVVPVMNDDAELLRRYVDEMSESAFAELVRRQVNFVYGVAFRRVGGDAHLAEDVTQQVFVALARSATAVMRHPVPSAWLYTTTRNIAAQTVRAAKRRQSREHEASIMNETIANAAPDWDRLRPVLDDALDELRDDDRQAVILRFFEGKSFADVGAQLRLSENAARMRVERALDKMHAVLAGRGVMSTTAALGAALANQVGIAAPVGLAAAVAGVALAGGGAAAGAGTGAAVATFTSMTKLQVGLAGAVALAGATGFVVQAQSYAELRTENEELIREERTGVNLRQEIERLAATAAEVAELRKDDVELARLRDEADVLRTKMQAAARAQNAARVVPGLGPVFNLNQLDQIPQASFRTAPTYPDEMRQAGEKGEVLVDFVVDADGNVQNAFAFKSTRREFEEGAVAAVKAWKFRPGRKNQLPVNVHMQVPIVFTLSTEADAGLTDGAKKASAPGNWF